LTHQVLPEFDEYPAILLEDVKSFDGASLVTLLEQERTFVGVVACFARLERFSITAPKSVSENLEKDHESHSSPRTR
jgi:hypothetical protein